MKTREKIAVVGVLAVMGLLAMCGSALATWTTPVPVTELNGGYLQEEPFLTADGKSLYFSRADGPTSSNKESIYEAKRQDTTGPFTSINKVLTDSYHARSPWVSADGLRMYYHNESSRWTIKVSTRTSINDPWQIGTGISEINQRGAALHPELTADEKTIFFHSIIGGNKSCWTASRADLSSPFGGFSELTEIMLPNDGCVSVSPDGLTIYFTSGRNGTPQMFRATRNSINDLFSNLEHLSVFDQPLGNSMGSPDISWDGQALYLCISTPDRPCDIYVSYIPEPATPIQMAIRDILSAIEEKQLILEDLEYTIQKEQSAMEAIEEALETGEYEGLTKGDLEKAKQKVNSAIQHQIQSKHQIEQAIKKLRQSLDALGKDGKQSCRLILRQW